MGAIAHLRRMASPLWPAPLIGGAQCPGSVGSACSEAV